MVQPHSHRFQHYALNANNELVYVLDTQKGEDETLTCPYCGQPMIAKRGDIRQWHFAHKPNCEVECSYDKYLHSLAERKILEWFNARDSILLEMECDGICKDKENCLFYDEEKCRKKKTKTFDLKKYFSAGILEHEFKGFIADIFCPNKNEKIADKPLFIEICVTHACTRKKINSNIHIIEFNITDEEDITRITDSSKIVEGENVILYNFSRHPDTYTNMTVFLQKFILYPSQKSILLRDVNCKNYNNHKGIFEMTLPNYEDIPLFMGCGGPYIVGKVLAFLYGYLKKDCDLCRWMRTDYSNDKFCVLYKKCHNPKYCSENNAATCTMFRVSSEIINAAKEEIKQKKENIPITIWKKEKDKQ